MDKEQLLRKYSTFKRDRYIKQSMSDAQDKYYNEYFQIMHEIRKENGWTASILDKDAVKPDPRVVVDLAYKEYQRRHPWQCRYYAVKNFLLGPFFKIKRKACERLDKAIMKALQPN